MSSGLLPNTTNIPFYHQPPKQQQPIKRLSTLRFPSVHYSSSFRAKAAVKEEGGLTEERRTSSFYDLLGISEGGSSDEIKRAYKQLARKYHPDVSPPDRTEEYTRRFIEVQEAYETLSDPRLKAIYDRDMVRGLHLAFSSRRRFDEICHCN
ncbi:chaperone protein dnaJ 20, chloroplastic [Asparagus officinalis]|uniref:chaperone protein dnaJ 20, chloroplastic n=1 Tax=Asparagus officinalis TaxID=4686 RepID=UPI00098E007B|nr:chaperone protein dnaJ 20, chloroplastic [Asparagus officinalis]